MRPLHEPIGLHLARVARVVSRGFDDALGAAGGSLPIWLVLLNLKARRHASQRELTQAIGVSEATLTHHLNAMEVDGLITRRRDPANRRVHIVELTAAGEATFLALRDAAVGFDRRLRHGLAAPEVAALAGLLDMLAANLGPDGAEPLSCPALLPGPPP